MSGKLDINITPEWAKRAAERDPESGIVSARRGETVYDQIVRDVAELPDRSSPDNWPEAMLVTGNELRAILTQRLGVAGEPVDARDAVTALRNLLNALQDEVDMDALAGHTERAVMAAQDVLDRNVKGTSHAEQ